MTSRAGRPGAHRPGVDVDQGRRPRHAGLDAVQRVVVTQQVHQVGGIGAVENRDRRRQTECLGVAGDHLVGDRVEGAALQPPSRVGPGAHGRRPGHHVVGGAAGERQQQDPFRRDPPIDQTRHPRRQGPGLAGTRAGQDHQRSIAVRGRRQLGVVQAEIPPTVEHTCDPSPAGAVSRSGAPGPAMVPPVHSDRAGPRLPGSTPPPTSGTAATPLPAPGTSPGSRAPVAGRAG